jgi:hypothetical protein
VNNKSHSEKSNTLSIRGVRVQSVNVTHSSYRSRSLCVRFHTRDGVAVRPVNTLSHLSYGLMHGSLTHSSGGIGFFNKEDSTRKGVLSCTEHSCNTVWLSSAIYSPLAPACSRAAGRW